MQEEFVKEAIMQIASSLLNTLKCEWGSFKIGELFDIQCSKYHNPNDYKEGEIPYIARTTFNNGVIKKISTSENLYPANCIIIGAESAKAFYQKYPFLTGNKIYRLYLKKEFGTLNQNSALFICALINKAGEKYNYTEAFISSRVEKESIDLPINLEKTGKIPNFSLMENFIKNIEQEHISKLLEYYQLVKVMRGGGIEFKLEEYLAFYADYKAKGIENKSLEWKEFKIGELFVSYNGDFDIQKTHLNNKGCFVVSSGEQDSGIIGKTDIPARIFPKNTITCDMFGNVFYRNFDYKMVTHARVFCLEFIAGNLNEKIALFIVATMKYLRFKFHYSNMASWRKIQNLTILLPVYEDSQIAFDFMESFIKAIEKESIKDVVLWGEKKLMAYKACVKQAMS